MRLQHKTALIAGASGAIDRLIAYTFAREDAEVTAVARQHEEELKRVARECATLGTTALPLRADLVSYQKVNRMAQQRLDQLG